jgi:hypothetical protein
MNRNPFSMRMSVVFGSLLGLYSAVALISTSSEPAATVLRAKTSWLLVDEESQLRRAYEQMGNGDSAGLKEAVSAFSALLRQNPASPYRWCDLGEAVLESGEVGRARYCFSRAYEFGPHVAPVLMRIANFHFRLGEQSQALEGMAKVLAEVSDYDGIIFSYYDRTGAGIGEVLDHGLPLERRAAQSYFRHVLQPERLSDADTTWRWIASHSFADQRLTCDYADFLLNNHASEKAARIWAAFLGPRKADYLVSNYVFNGDFESEPARCGLDWRTSEVRNVEVTRDSGVARSGQWSLRIGFQTEENLNFSHVWQTAYVKPGLAHFEAFLRSAELSTDQGVGFHIFDAESPTRLDIFTEQLTGTSEWRKIEANFPVHRNTKALTIQVVRRPSLKFDNKIRGTVWIDGVSLQLESQP